MDQHLTYTSYLKLDELLSLQQPLSEGPEHDETLFIIIHQVYELWFKQVLHEVDYLQTMFEALRRPRILATLKRILTILKTLVGQVDILETMTPTGFLSFRARLEAASGFQSAQFRELEFVLGKRTPSFLHHVPPESKAAAALNRRADAPTVYQSFLRFLAGAGYPIPEELFTDRAPDRPEESPVVQAILLQIYREDPELMQVCELLVDLDEGLQEWRYRHVRMVERTIGFKSGTGGSSGAAYLRSTLFQPIFPDLWAIRSAL